MIDEYDKPITEFIEDIEKAKEMRAVIKDFYITLKEADEHIHFMFLTGVSKFSKTSVFSALNNINDITLDEKYSKILGIDENQLYSYFGGGIQLLAKKLNKTEIELKKELKSWYNGYSWDGKNFLYNPYSLVVLFSKNVIANYWFDTGTPTFLIKMIRKYYLDVKELDGCILDQKDFDSYEVDDMNVYALLFQTGYLTIKEIINPDSPFRSYVLSYPNMEVKESFLNYLLKDFVNNNQKSKAVTINRLTESLEKGNLDDFIKIMKTIFDDIPYDIFIENKEAYYHSILYMIINLIGVRINAEMEVSTERIDCVIETDKIIYIFEFKLGTAKTALNKIESKGYYNKYLESNKQIYLVGVGFSVKLRNIKSFLLKEII
ncbi:MAG: AAA family ATPase [Candidatus Sericytochromatia bacterium]|nr:AAA family ATPase [Candidatus Sericytochromatia bacterium]